MNSSLIATQKQFSEKKCQQKAGQLREKEKL
jgi:hypothetical protein